MSREPESLLITIYRLNSMSIIATQPEKQERELIKAGLHTAYLYRVIYLGTQKKTFEGKEVQQQKIWIDFELPKEVVEYEDKDTKEKKSFVRTIGGEYTLSLSEKGKLLPLIQGWLGRSLNAEELKSFDICTLLGKPAFVTVAHVTAKNGSEYANIASVSPAMDGFVMPRPVNIPVEIGKNEWDTKLFTDLPEFIQKKIQESNEWKLKENQMTESQGDNQTQEEEIPIINLDDERDEIKIESVPF